MHRRLVTFLLLLTVVGCSASAPEYQAIAPPQDAWFAENVTSQSVPVIVDFTATWCGPCRGLKPLLEQLETEYAGKVIVLPIDVDARKDLATHYKVNAYPMLLMMQSGKVVDICRGAPPTYEDLKSWALSHLK